MSYTISFVERAMREYESATEWYLLQSADAAINFEAAVTEKINLLRINPDSFKKKYKQFHEVALKKYPYSIVYLIDQKEGRVIISSIFHHKHSPRRKYKK